MYSDEQGNLVRFLAGRRFQRCVLQESLGFSSGDRPSAFCRCWWLARHAYRMILGRLPRADEVEKGEQFLASMREHLSSAECAGARCEQGAWAGYLRALLAGNEFMFVE